MTKPSRNYDELSDTLSINFAPGEPATGIELTDHILLRLSTKDMHIIGITIFDYSIVAQQTDIGPRNFPLTGLEPLPPDLREHILDLLLQPPMRSVLALSAYTPPTGQTTPLIALQPVIDIADAN